MHKQFDERLASPAEFGLADFPGRHFADDFVECRFGDARQFSAKKDFAGADCLGVVLGP